MTHAATITDAKAAVDLQALVESSGVELRPAGPGRLRGLCPFHAERTGSFFVFLDRQRWNCFGCGEHGDAIDFIRKARGCSFREALAVLGMDDPKHTAAELQKIRAERQRREAAAWRERELARSLGISIRISHQALERITPETLEHFALILTELETLEYQHSILIHGDPAERAELVRELAGLRLLPRRLLFRRGFDFKGWACSLHFDKGPRHGRPTRTPGNPGRATSGTAEI
jgi:transcriptional regulator with XRE-family HTH domain